MDDRIGDPRPVMRVLEEKGPVPGWRSVWALLVLLVSLCWASVALATEKPAAVRLGDEVVFTLERPLGKQTAKERAAAAEAALEALVLEEPGEIKIIRKPGSSLLQVGSTTIVELTEEDQIAEGRADLESYVSEVAMKVRSGLEREQRRSRIARRVLSISSVVFLGLIALLLLRAVRTWARSADEWVDAQGDRIGALRIHTVELMHPAAAREAVRIGTQGALWLLRFGILYAWGLLTLSLFDSTRALAQRMTGRLFSPGAEFLERLGAQVPILVAFLIGAVVLLIAVRFALAYFAAIEKGEVDSDWARPETARVTGRLVAFGIVLGAMLFVVPLLTGKDDGLLTRVGVLALGAVALALTPLWASCALGIRLVYARHIRVGDFVVYGGHSGRVLEVGLFDITLIDDEDMSVRVPHLMSLWHVTRAPVHRRERRERVRRGRER